MASFLQFFLFTLVLSLFLDGITGSTLERWNHRRHEMEPYEEEISEELPEEYLDAVSYEDREELFPGCPHCRTEQDLEEEEMRVIRIEIFKQQILDRLRLPFAPNASFPAPPHRLPAPLRRDMMQNENNSVEHSTNLDDFHAKTTEVIVFATKSKYYNPFRESSSEVHSLLWDTVFVSTTITSICTTCTYVF